MALQVELVKFHAWVRDSGKRIAVVFEGRDAAGKGGTIKRGARKPQPARRAVSWRCPSRPNGRRRNGISSATSQPPARRGEIRAFRPVVVQPRRGRTCLRLLHPTERATFFDRCRISSRCWSMTASR
jgi:hypothetical protein